MPLAPRLRILEVGPAPVCHNAVWIPTQELADRTMELPPRSETIRLADTGPETAEGVRVLENLGRTVERVPAELGENVPGRLWAPNPFLERLLPNLRPGRSLDLACGGGREAIALAAHGWEVTAIDHLPDALERGRAFAHRVLGKDHRITFVQRNLIEDGLPEGSWDLITMFFFLDRPLVQLLPSHLSPGGSLILETFLREHRERFGKPHREELTLAPGELVSLTLGAKPVLVEEGLLRNRYTARLWSQAQIADPI